MSSDLEQKAMELVQQYPCKVYYHEEGCACVEAAILAALREVQRETAFRCAEICVEVMESYVQQGKPLTIAAASSCVEAIHDEFGAPSE